MVTCRGPDFAAPPRAVGALPLAPVIEDADAFLTRLESGRPTPGALRLEDAVALDALAAACARGGGAYELAIGEGLELLARSGGELRLGFSCVGDLARERLGLAPWASRRLRRNAVALRARPLLRAAVVSGELSLRKAEVVLPVAVGEDEAYWVERAAVDTVRRLEAAVARPAAEEEDWHRLRLALPREQAELVEGALAVAKVVLGPTATVWKQLWALAAEFLASHPSEPIAPASAARASGLPHVLRAFEEGAPRCARGDRAAVAATCGRGGTGTATAEPCSGMDVGAGAGSAAPSAPAAWSREPSSTVPPAPYALVASLARLVEDRAAADERLGRACLLVKRLGVARRLGWSSFEEWCTERLGLAPSTVYQRVALERRLAALPELREALRTRRLSYEQARLVARVATPADVGARIEEAAGKTCIALVRDLEAEARLQMCDAGVLTAAVPDEVESLLADAIRAARLAARQPLSAGEALVEISRHFVWTWAPEVLRLVKGTDRVVLRDGGLCQIPGCSRPAAHVHHLWFRSAGGPAEDWNELSTCLPHHLLGVHRGFVLVTGRAPDGLTFVLGEREVAAARGRAWA